MDMSISPTNKLPDGQFLIPGRGPMSKFYQKRRNTQKSPSTRELC